MCNRTKLLTRVQANLGAELPKLFLPEWLCENVTQLLICSNELHLNLARLCIVPDDMKFDINVLTPVMMHWIFHQRDCRLVVYPQQWLADS